tara:strand:+ start:93 stop:743 length:651 start_codon:yes stop_codon:yes gene_type:complete
VGIPRHKKRLKNKVTKDTRTIFSTRDLIQARGWVGAFKYIYVESFPNKGFLKKTGLLGLFYVCFYFIWPCMLLVTVPYAFIPAPHYDELYVAEGVLEEYKYSRTRKGQDTIVVSSSGSTQSYGGRIISPSIKTVKDSLGATISVKWHEPGALFVFGKERQFVELTINGEQIGEYDHNHRIIYKRYFVVLYLVSYLSLFGFGYRRWKKVDRYLQSFK